MITRNETQNSVSKSLEVILPGVEPFTVVVDDRLDVWNSDIDNVVQVEPYQYFTAYDDPIDNLVEELYSKKRSRYDLKFYEN